MMNDQASETPVPKSATISRRKFVGGVAGGMALGAAGAYGVSRGIARLGDDPHKPTLLYEHYLDNYWFHSVDLYNQAINAPLKGSHQAEIVIIGGGYTGLSSAYHLMQRFPDKKIVLLEGACCGYGASGRNGGQVSSSYAENPDVGYYGVDMIARLQAEEGLDCDFQASGHLIAATDEQQAEELAQSFERWRDQDEDAVFLEGEELRAEINSPRYLAAVRDTDGGIVNPGKLSRGLKQIVEAGGVEIRERTLVTGVTPGQKVRVETEMGDITAPVVVLALNAYSHKLGFFKNRSLPIGTYMIATEPLSEAQLESIGWDNRQAVVDLRPNFDYMQLTADGRIAMGGSDYIYYANDGLSSGNHKGVIEKLTRSLIQTFPQLDGLGVDYAWGGTVSMTLDDEPSVGVMGDHQNIFYGVGYNGSGVGFAMMAGGVIADLIAGESTDLTKLHFVNHKVPYAGPQSWRVLPARAYKWYLMG